MLRETANPQWAEIGTCRLFRLRFPDQSCSWNRREGLPGDTRTYRSTLTQRLNRTLARLLLRRHAVEHVELGKARVSLITHRIHWHRNRAYRFVLDFDAGAVSIPSLSPGTPPQELLRELRNALRTAPAATTERGLHPDKGELHTFVKHGSLTLSITVRNDTYEYCAEYLVGLASEILNACVGPTLYLDQDASKPARGTLRPYLPLLGYSCLR